MPYILVAYESLTGHVEEMATHVANGVRLGGYEARLIPIDKATHDDLLGADGIIVGSYTSYGIVAGGTKQFFDRTFPIHGKLQGKVGAAFASSGGLGGGNETTVLSILQVLLVHGMIVPGDSDSPHFGAVAVEAPDAASKDACERLGKRVADVSSRLAGKR